MAALHTISPHGLFPLSKTNKTISKKLAKPSVSHPKIAKEPNFLQKKTELALEFCCLRRAQCYSSTKW
ncbi:hypothetical protein NC651_033539 [Populus alba x Populus x berolinensis]|nr:hypothetical protein NC651_033539 [Populus alba x Populus x berolinensis]